MSIQEVRRRVEEEVRLLLEFMNELKWLDRGLRGEKVRVVAGGKVVKEDPKPVRDRALLALKRLTDPKFSNLLKKYGITLLAPEDITKNY